MIDGLKRMTNRTGHVMSAILKTAGRSKAAQYTLALIAAMVTFATAQTAHASTVTYTTPAVGLTGVENTTYTVYDIINSVLAVIYPSIIPIIVAGSTIFAAWWVWHRLRGAVS